MSLNKGIKPSIKLVSAVFFMMASIQAFSGPQGLASSLIYDGKPIDAMCFTESKRASLKNCGIHFKKDMEKTGQNQQLEKQDYIGYEYHVKSAGPTSGYSYYRPIAHFENKNVILTVSSGGGSGAFTAIKTVERTGDKLTIKNYDMGDRCNHGIFDVKQDTQQITYRAHITPFDFLTLANENPHKLQAYHDLEACAACCAGTVLISRPLNMNFSTATIVSVDFSHYSLNEGEATRKKPYQGCFNSLIATYKAKHETVLTLAELKIFVRQFNQQCVR